MAPPVNFGRRGLASAPPPPPRRMRSGAVAVGAIGLLAAGVTASAGYREYRCQPPKQGEIDERPNWCRQSSHGHYSGGHGGWGFASGHSGGASHASFGGFGGHGAGHGGGT